MFTRRTFVKSAVYAGAGIFIVEPFLGPLTALAHYMQPKGSDTGIERLFNHIYTMIQQNPDKYRMALNMQTLASLNIRCGNRRKGLGFLSEAIEMARKEKSDLKYASVLNSAVKIYYDIGEKVKAIETASESFKILSRETNNESADIEIVDNAMMIDRLGDREKALWRLDERYKNGFLTPSLAYAYADLGFYDKSMEVAHRITHDMVKISAMANIAELCANKGEVEIALNILSQAEALRSRLEQGRRSGVCVDITRAYAKLGDWDGAFIIDPYAWNSEECYYWIATHAVNAGRMDVARKATYPALADIRIDDRWLTFSFTFPKAAGLFLSLGDPYNAAALLKRFMEYLEENTRVPTYICVKEFSDSAAVFIKMGKQEEALHLLHRAFNKVAAEE